MRNTTLWMLALLLILAPLTATGQEEDLLLRVLDEWAGKTVAELSLEGSPSPSRTVMAALDHDYYSAKAVFGSLVTETGHRSRPGRVEVVVGDDTLNSSRFRSKDRLPAVVMRPSFVVEDVEAALARDLWLVSDHAYKNAVMQLRVKGAALAALGGDPPPPDWSDAPPVVDVAPAAPVPVDGATLRAIAELASGRLRGVEGLRHGECQVRAVEGQFYLVTSDGTRIVQEEGYAVVYAWADLLKEDGVQIYDRRQWVARTVADLPSAEVIADEVEAMGRRLGERAAAEVVDYYEGPVVFEGSAAADFFRYLIPKEICGTPPVPQADRTYQQQTRTGPRIKRRLLPGGWSVVDDPGRELPGVAGSYRYDREGVAGQRVSLVEDGYVRRLLMTRVPRAELQASNGHARGSIQGSWTARPSVWEVIPHKNLSARAFDKLVDRSIHGNDLERVLVVRRVQAGKAGGLPRPTEAVWRFPDGHEEPVQSLSFSNVDRRTLRDIVAAGGGQQVLPYLDSWSLGGSADGDTGIPAVILAPQSILVGEIEAVYPGPSDKPHVLPQPEL